MQLGFRESILLFIYMSENESNPQKSIAVILNPETEELIGRVSLVGDFHPATKWINAKGPLQNFDVIEGMEELREVWAHQEEVLLRTNYGQCSVQIVTYPTEGENQGCLSFNSNFEQSPKLPNEQRSKSSLQRGFAFLQSLLSI